MADPKTSLESLHRTAQAHYAELSGDLARVDAQLSHVKKVSAHLAAHHRQNFERSAAAMRGMRGSALEDAYHDDLGQHWLARTLAGDEPEPEAESL